jgi:transcriptional regulator with XRE-family HTH domain
MHLVSLTIMMHVLTPDLFRAARAMLNLTQEELAQEAGLERRIIARLESNQDNVKINQAVQLRRALECLGIEFTDGSEFFGPGLRWKTSARR